MLDVNVFWDENTEDNARAIAKLLYQLNEGLLEEQMGSLLVDVGNELPQQQPFVKRIFELWRKEQESDPVLLPTQVFGLSNINNKGNTPG